MNGFYLLVTKVIVSLPESPWLICAPRAFTFLNLYCSHGLYQTPNPKLLNTKFQRQISRVRAYYPTKEGTLLAPLTLVFVCYGGLDQHPHSSALLDEDVSDLPHPCRGKVSCGYDPGPLLKMHLTQCLCAHASPLTQITNGSRIQHNPQKSN